jgi:hypothetical protein
MPAFLLFSPVFVASLSQKLELTGISWPFIIINSLVRGKKVRDTYFIASRGFDRDASREHTRQVDILLENIDSACMASKFISG